MEGGLPEGLYLYTFTTLILQGHGYEAPLDVADLTYGARDRVSPVIERDLEEADEGSQTAYGHYSTRDLFSSNYESTYKDPFWPKQWYMQKDHTDAGIIMDLNVVPVHKDGYPGKNIKVALIDSWIQHDHPDLDDNFLAGKSYDYCQKKKGSHPDSKPSRGTETAGIIAMEGDNKYCGVGVAYKAKLIGVRGLCPSMPEAILKDALVHELDEVHVYYCHFGTPNDGTALIPVSPEILQAYEKGYKTGRKTLGSIYVFGSGTGKASGDNCATDIDIQVTGVMTFAAAGQGGTTTPFSERCAAIYATAYGAAAASTEGLVGPKGKDDCVSNIRTTSAASAVAAGIIAITLDVSEKLSYRDMMHIVVYSAEPAPLFKNSGWNQNGKGLWVSNDFGFGLLNAERMAKFAKKWKKVPDEHICPMDVNFDKPVNFDADNKATLTFETDACMGKENAVLYLEHVKIIPVIRYGYRGDLIIELVSPSEFRTTILEPRKNDRYSGGIKDYHFKSVHNWGESPRGKWTIEISLAPEARNRRLSGTLTGLQIIFHGTEEKPSHYSKPKVYTGFSKKS